MLLICRLSIPGSAARPRPPGMILTPAGPSSRISCSSQRREKASVSVCRALTPAMSSMFPNPRSASRMATDRPMRARASARCKVRKLFPTPPLPLVSAITLTGFVLIILYDPQCSGRTENLRFPEHFCVGSQKKTAPCTAVAWERPSGVGLRASPTLTRLPRVCTDPARTAARCQTLSVQANPPRGLAVR